MIYLPFHKNLRFYREKNNISAKDFAEMIGIPYATYKGYENLGREPKFNILIKISNLLHISTDELLGNIEKNDDEHLADFIKILIKPVKNKLRFIGIDEHHIKFRQLNFNEFDVDLIIDKKDFIQLIQDKKAEYDKFILQKLENSITTYAFYKIGKLMDKELLEANKSSEKEKSIATFQKRFKRYNQIFLNGANYSTFSLIDTSDPDFDFAKKYKKDDK